MESHVDYYLTRATWNDEHRFWLEKPVPVFDRTRDNVDCMFWVATKGSGPAVTGVYGLDILFPGIGLKAEGIKRVRITKHEDGSFSIREIADETARTTK